MPCTNPAMTGYGTKRTTCPMRKTPPTTCSAPAMTTATQVSAMMNCGSGLATSRANAETSAAMTTHCAVRGELMVTGVEAKIAATRPPAIAPTRQASTAWGRYAGPSGAKTSVAAASVAATHDTAPLSAPSRLGPAGAATFILLIGANYE